MGAETNPNQYPNNTGSVTQSLKRKRYRRSHPPEPAYARTPIETKENKNAFKKQSTKSMAGIERAIKRADSKKGIKAAFSRPTIDTEHESVLCIKEVTSVGEDE